MSPVYRVKDWDDLYESSKSRTFIHKTQAYIPNAITLPMQRLIKAGEEVFGAWVALILLLSRQPKPRDGFLTENGRIDGEPLTAETISLLTHFSAETVAKMLHFCASQPIGLLYVAQDTDTMVSAQEPSKDTARILQGGIPLPHPYPHPYPPQPRQGRGGGGGVEVDLTWYEEQSSLLNRHLPDCHPQFDAPRLNLMLTATPAINSLGTDVWAEGIAAWIADQQGRSNPPRDPMAALRFFLSKRASALPGEGVHTVHTSKNFGAPADPSKIWEGLRITGVGDVDAPDAMLAAKLARRTQQPVKATA